MLTMKPIIIRPKEKPGQPAPVGVHKDRHPEQPAEVHRDRPPELSAGIPVLAPGPILSVVPLPPAFDISSLEVVLVRDRVGLDDMESRIYSPNPPKRLFLDVETAVLDPSQVQKKGKGGALDPFLAKPVTVQIQAGNTVFIVRPDLMEGEAFEDPLFFGCLQRLLMDSAVCKVFHNAKFDLKFILKHLLHGRDLGIENLFDTFLAEACLSAGKANAKDEEGDGPLSLASLSRKYIGVQLSKEEQTSFVLGKPLTPEQRKYCVTDVAVLGPIMSKQVEELKRNNLQQVAKLEFAVVPAVVMAELVGIQVNPRQYYRLLPVVERKRDRIKGRLQEMVAGLGNVTALQEDPAGLWKKAPRSAFNPNSVPQVKALLNRLGFKVESTAEKTLKKIDHPFAKALLECREVSKLLTTYLEPLPRHVHPDGRVRPEFKQMGSEAGRFSCVNPNLQQVPRLNRFRKLFMASQGCVFVIADYGSIEMRVLGELSQDPALLEAFRAKEHKFFKSLASHLFGVAVESVTKAQYDDTKTICYGLNYGQGAVGLAERRGSTTKEAEELIARFFKMFPSIKSTLDRLGRLPISKGYTETLLGRRRYFSQPETWGEEKFIERQGRNTPIQGTAGDVFKLAVVYLYQALQPYEARIVNLVHDEVIVECLEDRSKEVEAVVKAQMIRAGDEVLKTVPIEVETNISKIWRK